MKPGVNDNKIPPKIQEITSLKTIAPAHQLTPKTIHVTPKPQPTKVFMPSSIVVLPDPTLPTAATKTTTAARPMHVSKANSSLRQEKLLSSVTSPQPGASGDHVVQPTATMILVKQSDGTLILQPSTSGTLFRLYIVFS